jgi:hypothetical protein
MKLFYAKSLVFTCASLLVVLGIAGCSDEITYVPVIESITVTQDTVTVGDTTMIQVVATDADDKDLVYYYTTTGGFITGTGDLVKWTAPAQTGVYMARVLVSDKDGNQASDSIRLVVVKNDSATEITGVGAFPSGMDFDLLDSKVRLYTSKDNWISHTVFAEVKTNGFGPIVSFRFDKVPEGTYYLDIWKDTDFGNTVNSGDYLGWYGRGDILMPNPEPFSVEAGILKELQIQMWVIPSKK